MERAAKVAKVAKDAKDAIKKKIKKTIDPLSNMFEEPDQNVEFAAWHRVGYIRCDASINDYNKLVEKFYVFNKKKDIEYKRKFFEEGKFIHINNSKGRELFGKIVDDLKNGNAIKRIRNIRQKKEFIINYDYINHEEINNKDVKETDNNIIDDSTINKIKENRETIEWFNFKNRYENYIERFNEEYSCNTVQSATGEAQDVAGGQDPVADVVQSGGYNKYLKNKKKSKQKKNKVTKGGRVPPVYSTQQPVLRTQPVLTPQGYMQPVLTPQGYMQPAFTQQGYMQPAFTQRGLDGRLLRSDADWINYAMDLKKNPQFYSMQNQTKDKTKNKTEGYYTEYINDYKDIILIIKNDNKNKIEFYQPTDITKVQRLKYILKGIINKEKEESKERLERNLTQNLGNYERGYLAHFGGNLNTADIIEAVKYTPIPLLSVQTTVVKNGLIDLKKGVCPDNDGFTIIFNKEDETEKNVTSEESELLNNIKEHIKEAKKNEKLLADQLDLTNYKNIEHFNNRDKYNYIFNIGDTNYCYSSSDIRVFLIKTTYDYIGETNREELKSFKDFEDYINEKIKELKEREEKIFEEAKTNINSNANRFDSIEEKDNERVDKILMSLATFLVHAIKELGKYLFKVITLLWYLFIEAAKTLSNYIRVVFSGWSKRWSNVAAGAIIFIIMFFIVFGITWGIIKSKPKNVRTINESDNANKKTLYSIITAIPSDISNAYNSFIKFTDTVNTMLFDAKKSFDDITTEMVYSEDSKLLEDRIKLPNKVPADGNTEEIKKRVDYIMHFATADGKNVNHRYIPKTPVNLKLGSGTVIGRVNISGPTGEETKYTATCSPDSDDSEYIGTDCKIKIKQCPDEISVAQESEQQTQPEKIEFENDYDNIIVST